MVLLELFGQNLLPIFLVAAVGYALAAAFDLDARALSLVTFNGFSPALVFVLLAKSDLQGTAVLRMAGFACAAILLPAVAALVYARLARLPRKLTAAVVLVVMLGNAGNYGLSLTRLAFGPEALEQAAIYFATSVALTYTVGVAVASLGTAGLRTAVLGVLRVPTVYAVLVAMVFKAGDLALPGPLDRSVELLAEAAIPAMLIVLGMQLRQNGTFRRARGLGPSVALRLLAGPAIAIALAPLFGLSGPARQAGIVEAAMPTAVVTTVLAEAYDLEPAFVTQAVVVSTLLSPITLTPLLAWLGAG